MHALTRSSLPGIEVRIIKFSFSYSTVKMAFEAWEIPPMVPLRVTV
jgi:hypothetical protein